MTWKKFIQEIKDNPGEELTIAKKLKNTISTLNVNLTAAKRILRSKGIDVTAVIQWKVFNNSVWVLYRTRGNKSLCSTFLSVKAFNKDAYEFRLNGAKKVVLGGMDWKSLTAWCQSSDKTEVYHINVRHQTCTCKDFKNGHKCKHIIAAELSLPF